MSDRRSTRERRTSETDIRIELDLEGGGRVKVESGLGFLDHMLEALAFHASFDLTLSCRGDLDVDDHHTVEDCAIAFGEALDEALGDRAGVVRFGSAYAPLDEALARAVVDLSGRPWAEVALGTTRERIGAVACENLAHVFRSLSAAARVALHVDVLRGDNDHHRVEAAFKATAIALRQAVARRGDVVRSTKGSLG